MGEQITGTTSVGGEFKVVKPTPIPTIWLILLTLAFTLFQISWSFRYYRLRAEPGYDDIFYIGDATARLNAFDHQSILSWFYDLVVRSQPHSPYSSFIAFLAFALFGYNEWAPYLLNGVLIFVLLMEIRRISTALPWYLQFVLLLFPLCLPLSRSAIVEFRPDFAEGLFGAVTVWRALELKFLSTTPRPVSDYLKLAGFAALTWLSKPTFFIHTAILMGVVTFFCLVLENRGREAWIRSLKIVGSLGLGLLIVLPYFLASWRSYWSYFQYNTGKGSLAEVWKVPGGLIGSLKYFLSGLSAEGGSSAGAMLGPFLGAFGLIALIGIAWMIVRKDLRRMIFYGSVACGAAASFAVVVYGRMAGPCFGLTFQILFVLMTVFVLVALLVSTPLKGIVACLLTAPIWIFAAGQPPAWGMLLAPSRVWAGQDNAVGQRLQDSERNDSVPINERFYAAIIENLRSQPVEKNRSPIINVCLVGDIIAETQKFYADRDQRSFAFKEFVLTDDPEAVKRELSKGDFVELADLDSSVREMRNIPIAKIEDDLIKNLSTDPKYRLIERFQLIKGYAYLFRKVDSP
jgi:hypothetical protein